MHLGISGHTDDQPISTAEFPSNWELSSARASRVARYLIEKGVHPERIAVHGFADHRPRVPNGNRTGRGANRRVELRLMRTSEAGTTQNSYAQSPLTMNINNYTSDALAPRDIRRYPSELDRVPSRGARTKPRGGARAHFFGSGRQRGRCEERKRR